MKIFFAGSIRGGRQLIPVYQYIIRFLKSRNCTIMSEHVGSLTLENILQDFVEKNEKKEM